MPETVTRLAENPAALRGIRDAVSYVLVCPACRQALSDAPEALRCTGCGQSYPFPEGGRPDLRLRRPLTRSVSHRLGEAMPVVEGLPLDPLKPAERPAVDFTGVAVPRHLTRAMLSYFPKAEASGRLALDLGCGRAIHRGVIEHAGFEYVGLDYGEEGAPILGDAHALPFADGCFDFVLSVAVLEHIRYPFVMIEEASRVMKPGAMLFGTVAFLEPWHDNSYFHHSHLGVLNVLRHAGLEVRCIAPNAGWSVLRAQARTLFPLIPRRIAQALVMPLHAAHRLWWLPIGWRSARYERLRRLKTAGAFTFIAVKP